jgi:membrane protein required for beta-lactamase induction
MARKGGSVKRLFLTVVLLALLVVVFILLGGGNFLKSAGKWMAGVGKDAETVKHQMEEKASRTGQAVEKVIETVKSGEKKGERK